MKTITVRASKAYDVTIGEGLLDDCGSAVRKAAGGLNAAIVTDDNVAELYESRLRDALLKNGYRVAKYVIPHGENSKNDKNLISLLNFLADSKFTREDVVVALGGGVVGDLAGFTAACYMRGVRFVQIPTTLLSMVDSSVGGKTAINLAAGKNLAGAFYQPDAVLCDVSLLSTLPPEVFRDGCAEVIKHGIILDREFFHSLEVLIDKQLVDVVSRCVSIKRDVVLEDEFEKGVRKLLNFGHTVGHAIELLSGYQISHGHAVAIGMAVEARAAFRMGICREECLRDILRMLRLYGLPVSIHFKADELAQACLSDKKREGQHIAMVFPTEIGYCVLKEVPVSEMEAVIRMGLAEEESGERKVKNENCRGAGAI